MTHLFGRAVFVVVLALLSWLALPGSAHAAITCDVVDDPAASTGRWGWAMIADRPERVAWLYGLARDDGASPIVYAEIPRLWELVAKLPDAGPQLGYAQPWLATRSLRAQLDIADGAPELRVLLKVES